MQAYAEILPPTAITHAVCLPFVGAGSANLIVAKTSLLQVFETRTVEQQRQEGDYNGLSSAAAPRLARRESLHLEATRPEHLTKLVLLGEFPVNGIITSLARIKVMKTKGGGEALLVSFKNAKISLVEWDPEVYGLSTISLHYYEGEVSQSSPWAPDLGQWPSYLTVDPSSRCAALKFGLRHLAILPFRQPGDDLVMGDYDPDLDETPNQSTPTVATTNGDTKHERTLHGSSFVLPLTALDPQLIHPVDLAFLYEYREPTLGVLSSSKGLSTSLLNERKDVLSYHVFTLDIEQRARTPLLAVSGLPYDLHKLVPLQSPVGGALLVGANEVLHIDQSGKTNAVSVNDFAKQCSSLSMADQSELALSLEDCLVEQLDSSTGDMLMVMNTGDLAVLSFRLDGRSVSGISIRRVHETRGGSILGASASCVVSLGQDCMFVGSEDGDSAVIRCGHKTSQLSRKRSHAEMLGLEETVSDEESEDEDDLYGNDPQSTQKHASSGSFSGAHSERMFSIQDRLPNLAPVGQPILSRRTYQMKGNEYRSTADANEGLELVIPIGRGRSGALAFIEKNLSLRVLRKLKLTDANNTWCVNVSNTKPGAGIRFTSRPDESESNDDKCIFLIVSHRSRSGLESSTIHSVTGSLVSQRNDTDFEAETATMNIGLLCGGTKIVQVTSGDVRSYDKDLALEQILPMLDEVDDTELKIVHSNFCDPYLLIIRNDSSALVLEANERGEISELERGNGLLATKWLSGSVHKPVATKVTTLTYLLSADGALHIFELPNLSKAVYVAEGLGYLPPVISTDHIPRRSTSRETLTEILVSDIGDTTATSPYLLVRTANNDLVIYQPYHYPTSKTEQSFTKNLRWLKIPNLYSKRYSEDSFVESDDRRRSPPLRTITNLNGYTTVFLPGDSPSLLLKEASSLPRVVTIRGSPICGFSSYNSPSFEESISVNVDGDVSIVQLPLNTRYGDNGWAVRKLSLDREIEALCYHGKTGFYVIGTNEKTEFRLPRDDWHQEWTRESDMSLKPHVNRGAVSLINPDSWSIIDTHAFEKDETLLCLKTLELEVSEFTHERKSLVVATTAHVRGEDINATGGVYVFEIISVVPELDRPETNHKLKLIATEEVKGAATALSPIGTQGFLIMAQGQKCMVRGLKEDNTLLPVAFMDMQCYVSVLKNLEGTGLALMGDAIKGIWFAGFSEEPCKITLFGKSKSDMEVMAADFLPHDKQLFILVADADCNIHVLEFNPERKLPTEHHTHPPCSHPADRATADPKSMSGQRLLHKSTFHTGHFPVSLSLLPSTLPTAPASNGDVQPPTSSYQLLLATQSGALGLITPLDEQTYRRLGALQTHMTGVLDHICGLNPRAYRAVESEGFGSRGILDGGVLMRWMELGSQRRAEACLRVGTEEWQVRSDLETISGGGLGYL